jgi:hypothetical protein
LSYHWAQGSSNPAWSNDIEVEKVNNLFEAFILSRISTSAYSLSAAAAASPASNMSPNVVKQRKVYVIGVGMTKVLQQKIAAQRRIGLATGMDGFSKSKRYFEAVM